MRKKKIICGILVALCGALALWLFLDHFLNFSRQDWVFERYPNMTLYYGVNIINKFADFAFFTYITSITFGIWCILFGISNCFKENKFNNFLRKSSVVSFVFTNYLITSVIYTVFELAFANDHFGLYADVPKAWHNLGINICTHYVIFIFAVIIFALIKTRKSNIRKGRFFALSFLVLYAVIVKITGEFAYSIRWFPYIIFDATSYGNAFGISSYPVCVLLTILTFVALAIVYGLLFTVFAHLKEKQCQKQLRNMVKTAK